MAWKRSCCDRQAEARSQADDGPQDETVKANVDGVAFLLKKNRIEPFHGLGSLLPKKGDLHQVQVRADDGATQVLEARNVVIATGSDVASLPGVTIDEKIVVSSTVRWSLALCQSISS